MNINNYLGGHRPFVPRCKPQKCGVTGAFSDCASAKSPSAVGDRNH